MNDDPGMKNMAFSFIRIAPRQVKPREAGLTVVADRGMAMHRLEDVIEAGRLLPTLGAARYTGGLWVGKYLKTVTYQEIDNAESSAELGRICGRAARLENFEGHARSGDVRAAKFGQGELSWTDHRLAPSASNA